MEKLTIVAGSLKDVHAVGLRVLGYVLREEFEVIHVGSLLEQEELIAAAIETNARAILVSSSYGHAELDCQGCGDKCREAGLKDVLLYIGGNLVVGADRRPWKEIETTFKKMGFNRVYPQDVTPEQVLIDIKHDLGLTH